MTAITKLRNWCHNDLYRDLTWWRKLAVRGLDWIEHRLWGRWVYPHMRPRKWYRERRDFWRGRSVPQQVNGFVWGTDDDGWLVELRDKNGPWHICWAYGATKREAQADAMDLLAWHKREAGTRNPEGGYSVTWLEREPTNAAKCYTR